jgi:8-oxo-dGTP pyrophosphatase MutT (NUDIX family)/phosphohistidine phosphatase SixA
MTGTGEPDPWLVTVRAAGTVLWRQAGTGRVEVAVVHRPHRADWSLPKGKLKYGETTAACAARETWEETGYHPVLGRPLGDVVYPVTAPTPGHKAVTFFAGHADDSTFRANSEVDELRWLRASAAADLLSYDTDRALLARFTALPPNTRTVLVVRHAKAGNRAGWAGPDEARPLSPAGQEQALALRAMLPLFGPDRVHAAARTRCVDTVIGVADDLGVPVAIEPRLTEEFYSRDAAATVRRLTTIVRAGGTPVVCTQGGVIPRVISALAEKSGIPLGRIPCKKGSTWVLSFSATKPLRLLAAHYLPTALPAPLPAPLSVNAEPEPPASR